MAQRLAGLALTALMATTLSSAHPALAAPAANPPAHVVQAGETLWSISRMYGLTPEALAQVNRLSSLDRLQIGQQLVIPASPPSVPGVHIVRSGETLWSIARRHGLSVDGLAAMNGLADANRLQLGQELSLTGRAVRRQAALRPRLVWPSRGRITSRFEVRWGRHHHGIDIAAPVGTPIIAALDGTVQFAGWRGGYGRLIILDHGGGLTTYYGHASTVLVKVGDRVTVGQLLARVGTTGQVTGPNLHFEVRKNEVPQDPLAFLQSRR